MEKLERGLDTQRAAKRLGVSPRTVQQMCHDGRIRAVNVGFGRLRARWRIPLWEVERLLRERQE